MRWILKIILFPISLVLSILIAFLTFLLGIGTALLYIVMVFCVFGALASFVQGEVGIGISGLVIGFLFSPYGLPMIGATVITFIGLINEKIKALQVNRYFMRRRGNLKEYIASLEKEFSLIENGFKEEEKRALTDYKSNDNEYAKNLAFLAYKSVTYQVRMYGVFLFGYLSEQDDILAFMRDEVSKDDNWRVQEVLAKAFDEFCKKKGYEKALPIIDEWLKNNNPNTRRAVTEGLRIWTSRPYFKENPKEAIERIANLKEDASEYVRKSVGNALRDISKKFPELIKIELDSWKLESKEIKQVYKLASKLIV